MRTFASQKQKELIDIGIWCNGNTTDSGPVILGSSPSIPTGSVEYGNIFNRFFM